MEKQDILSTDFYLKKLICVLKSEIRSNIKELFVDGRHSHAFVYILTGSCTYNFNNEYEITANQGDVLYLAHNDKYTMHIHEETYSSIYCDFELNDDVARKSRVYTPQNTFDVKKMFERLIKTYNEFSKPSFSKCISEIYSIYSLILMSDETHCLEQTKESIILKTKEYIDNHFTDVSLSISELAQISGFSEVYFRKLFKLQYHMSPSQYITEMRISKAKQLLEYRFLTLDECAVQIGFLTVQYFCRVFKRITGMTPTEYRNNYLN